MGFYSDLMGFYSDLMGYIWDIPFGNDCYIAIEHGPVEIVVKHSGSFHSYVTLPEGRLKACGFKTHHILDWYRIPLVDDIRTFQWVILKFYCFQSLYVS